MPFSSIILVLHCNKTNLDHGGCLVLLQLLHVLPVARDLAELNGQLDVFVLGAHHEAREVRVPKETIESHELKPREIRRTA